MHKPGLVPGFSEAFHSFWGCFTGGGADVLARDGAWCDPCCWMRTATKPDVCPLCDDSGWKPAAEGRVTRCECRLRKRGETIEEGARIPKRYAKCEISNFEKVAYKPENSKGPEDFDHSVIEARVIAEGFIKAYPIETNKGLLILGKTGRGKTHLAVGVIKELMRKGIPCLFSGYRELLSAIRQSYSPAVQTTELEVLRPVLETEVVLIDDLGASVAQTVWEQDMVAYILNRRYSDELTTIVTTQLLDLPTPQFVITEDPESSSQLKRTSRDTRDAKYATREKTLGERIGDQMRARVHEMCRKVEIDGRDYRDRAKS